MAPNDTDRRRFLLATALDPARAAGVVVGEPARRLGRTERRHGRHRRGRRRVGVAAEPRRRRQHPSRHGRPRRPTPPPVITAAPTTGRRRASAPVFLDGPSGAPARRAAEIAVPAAPDVGTITTVGQLPQHDQPDRHLSRVEHRHRHRRSRSSTSTTATRSPASPRACTRPPTPVSIMHTDTFAQIADLTDAPIPVEISQ